MKDYPFRIGVYVKPQSSNEAFGHEIHYRQRLQIPGSSMKHRQELLVDMDLHRIFDGYDILDRLYPVSSKTLEFGIYLWR